MTAPELACRLDIPLPRWRHLLSEDAWNASLFVLHLKIAGRIAFFAISSGYQPWTAKAATHPFLSCPAVFSTSRFGIAPG